MFRTSRRLLVHFALSTATLTATAVLCGVAPAAEQAERPPNFIIFFTDDQGYNDVGCYGAPLIETPHFDRMAAEGMRLSQFYSASPVCTPSRFTCLTGKYASRCQHSGFRNSASDEGQLSVQWNTSISPPPRSRAILPMTDPTSISRAGSCSRFSRPANRTRSGWCWTRSKPEPPSKISTNTCCIGFSWRWDECGR